MKNLKTILLLLLIAALTIPLAVIPNIISPDVEEWCKITLGEDYKTYLILFFVVGSVLVVFLTSDLNILKKSKAPSNFNIVWNEENKALIQKAKKDIERARSADALKKLAQIDSEELQKYISKLKARLSGNQLREIQGTETYENTTTTENKLNRGILSLISIIESNQVEDEEYVHKIKEYLQKRYSNRLSQKLAGRQPVNLRRLPSTKGTSEEQSVAFVTYNEDEIRDGIGKIFEDANGRLLIIGSAGSGKTTLLLQLELYLLTSAKNTIPIILNLATWQSEFTTIEDWLIRILPAEMGVNKALAKKVIEQYPLILLLDGFDEIKKGERDDCLEAIGKYSANTKHRFVIASRIGEYKEVTKDAPVYSQIEVGALTIEQIEHELERVGRSQPEALPLLNAIQKDILLREVVKTPFYFNTLQLMFAQGKRLNDLNFKTNHQYGRQNEIVKKFVELAVTNFSEDKQEKFKNFLAFLASRMNDKNLVVFELLDLQYSWVKLNRFQKWVSKLLEDIVSGVSGFLPLGFVLGIVGNIMLISNYNGMWDGLTLPFIFKVIFLFLSPFLYALFIAGGMIGLSIIMYSTFLLPFIKNILKSRTEIKTREIFEWSFHNLFKNYWKIIKENLINGLKDGIQLGAFIGLIIAIFSFSLYNFFLFAFIGATWGFQIGFLKGLFLGIGDSIKGNIYSMIKPNTPYHRFKSSMKFLYFSIIQHFHLRFILCKKKLLPFKLIFFLNQMTKNYLLESDGATWRFRHRILQDHFANLWSEYQKEGGEAKNG